MDNSDQHPFLSSFEIEFPDGSEQTLVPNEHVVQATQPSAWPQLNPAIPGHLATAMNPANLARDNQPLNSRVPIPRPDNPVVWAPRSRVRKACDSCKDQKVKCSGDRPVCQRCQDFGNICTYGSRKRERIVKQLDDLAVQVDTYEALLRDIRHKLDPQTAQHVAQVLDKENTQNETSPVRQTPPISAPEEPGARIGSDRTLAPMGPCWGTRDYVNEDFNRDGRAQDVGFVGEHSATSWLLELKRAVKATSSLDPLDDQEDDSIASVTYFMASMDMPVINDADLIQRPPRRVADQLLENYFNFVHPSFPIISRTAFLGQCKTYFSSSVQPGKEWLAILNLIFAIATSYYRPPRTDAEEETLDDGSVYFARAWKLGMSTSFLAHINLQQVQVQGLISFYLMTVGQINWSWSICGVSVRSAITMGLNMRNEVNTTSPISREIRCRVWWSLYTLDVSLSLLTGRPPNNSDRYCTTPYPLPLKEENLSDDMVVRLVTDHEARSLFLGNLSMAGPGESTRDEILSEILVQPEAVPINRSRSPASHPTAALVPNDSLYFLYLVNLDLILRESIDKLYAPTTKAKQWSDVEVDISTLLGKADTWLSILPPALHFTQGAQDLKKERSSLAFRFYSTKMLITQPCLRNLPQQLPNDFRRPGNFFDTAFANCVDQACHMLNLLPDPPSFSWITGVSPWWFLLHYLVQATSVLQKELLLRQDEDTVKYEKTLEQIFKAMSWLDKMALKDPSARKALFVCQDLISRHVPGFAESQVSNMGRT